MINNMFVCIPCCNDRTTCCGLVKCLTRDKYRAEFKPRFWNFRRPRFYSSEYRQILCPKNVGRKNSNAEILIFYAFFQPRFYSRHYCGFFRLYSGESKKSKLQLVMYLSNHPVLYLWEFYCLSLRRLVFRELFFVFVVEKEGGKNDLDR